MKIDWVKKLTSRKFWMAIASFVSMMFVFFGGAESTATQITALIMAGGTVVAYIIGEGLADAGHATDVQFGEIIAEPIETADEN